MINEIISYGLVHAPTMWKYYLNDTLLYTYYQYLKQNFTSMNMICNSILSIFHLILKMKLTDCIRYIQSLLQEENELQIQHISVFQQYLSFNPASTKRWMSEDEDESSSCKKQKNSE